MAAKMLFTTLEKPTYSEKHSCGNQDKDRSLADCTSREKEIFKG
jgi:hypothetical protein